MISDMYNIHGYGLYVKHQLSLGPKLLGAAGKNVYSSDRIVVKYY